MLSEATEECERDAEQANLKLECSCVTGAGARIQSLSHNGLHSVVRHLANQSGTHLFVNARPRECVRSRALRSQIAIRPSHIPVALARYPVARLLATVAPADVQAHLLKHRLTMKSGQQERKRVRTATCCCLAASSASLRATQATNGMRRAAEEGSTHLEPDPDSSSLALIPSPEPEPAPAPTPAGAPAVGPALGAEAAGPPAPTSPLTDSAALLPLHTEWIYWRGSAGSAPHDMPQHQGARRQLHTHQAHG